MKQNKIVKFENLGIEVDFNQEQYGKTFKEIKIREGWRLLRIGELGEIMNYILDNNLDIWSFFEQPFKKFKNKYIARLGANSNRAGLNVDRGPGDSFSSLGVIFCRDIKR